MILLIDPEHEMVGLIKKNILTDKIIEPEFNKLALHMEAIVRLMVEKKDCNEVNRKMNQLLAVFSGTRENHIETDHRILRVCRYIDGLDEKKVSIKKLTELVHLSESRLSHLFKAQLGVPVRRYLLWVRLMDALKNAMQGKSLTNAAYDAGFSDSAHLSRTFRSMFGSSPSNYIKNEKDSRFVQLINCI